MERPRLRPLDIRPVRHQGHPFLLLRDPLGLSDRTVMVPAQLGPLLALADGTRDLRALHTAFLLRTGLSLPFSQLEALFRRLDDALMLDNERYREACRSALSAYRSAPSRRPALAGNAYPAEPSALLRTLEGYASRADPPALPARRVAGLLSPHIDYARGGPVYAGVWTAVREALREVERVILLGTDHAGAEGRLTLTRQNYASPLGVLPTDRALVDRLADALGPEHAFADELHHLGEHSVELAFVWLQFALGERQVEMVPVLCGGMRGIRDGEPDPDQARAFEAFLEVVGSALRERPTLVVAAGDLAHVGPAFGDPLPLGPLEKARLRAQDRATLERVARGDAEGFLEEMRREGDARRYCGMTPLYLALRLMGPVEGILTGYEQCPADEEGGSVVSVAGMVFLAPP